MAKMMNEYIDNYFDLAGAIYRQSIEDYVRALKKLKKSPGDIQAKYTVYAVERFLKNDPYEIGIDRDFMIKTIKTDKRYGLNPITQEDIEKVRKLYCEEGIDQPDIALKLKLTKRQVENIIRKNNFKKYQMDEDEIIKAVLMLRKKGCTYAELARKLHISYQNLNYYLKKYGMTGRLKKEK